jgi:hypothetical protein
MVIAAVRWQLVHMRLAAPLARHYARDDDSARGHRLVLRPAARRHVPYRPPAAAAAAARGRARAVARTGTHSHYRPGTQKCSESQNRTARSTWGLASFDRLAKRFEVAAAKPQAAATSNRLESRSKLPKVERAPFWVYCSLLWVHVPLISGTYIAAAPCFTVQ